MPTIRALTLVLLFAGRPAAAQQSDSIPVPTAFEKHYVAFLYRAGGPEGAAAQRIIQEHMQFRLRLVRDGVSIASGPVTHPGDSTLLGMSILRAASLEEARHIAEADPGVRQGRYRVQVMEWFT